MEDFTVEVTGLDALQKTLEELPAKVAKRGLRAALRAGAEPIKAGMVSMAPRHTGFLAEHFDVKTSLQRNELAGTAYIGPSGKMEYPAFLSGAYRIVRKANGKVKQIGRISVMAVARYLEFGTVKMAKKPFMTQAFESHKEQALDAVVKVLADAVEHTK